MHLLLLHYSCYPLHYKSKPSPSSTSLFSIKNPIGLRGDNYEVREFKKKKKGRNGAADRDSEFEVDPDKAREALKKLDEQLQSLSKKQTNPPKIRAVGMKQSIDDPSGKKSRTESVMEENMSVEISGSFLASVAGGLLLFTIFYNILFLTVIKPSIDGVAQEPSAISFSDVIQETQGDAIQELSSITEVPLSP